MTFDKMLPAVVREVFAWVDRLLALQGCVLPTIRPEVEARLRDGRTGDRLAVPDLFVRHFGVLRGEAMEPGAAAIGCSATTSRSSS